MSRSFIKHAISNSISHLNGAVRHAAESFNYYWPQELDDDYLVVWEGFHGGVHWRHLGPAELRAFLVERIADGYVFPLNPKWLLCDPGW